MLRSINSVIGLTVFDWNRIVLEEAEQILSFVGTVVALGKLILVLKLEDDGEELQNSLYYLLVYFLSCISILSYLVGKVLPFESFQRP